ncbi:hypothetical protein [Streptomyces sp. WAC06614]|uniref:hypothetical protein n=1 Tax=Streptomyces sp. WAC06614 TaxID=2487416 RepID=UPI000F79210F|nr:hypothetical protein [Streptomyces sp. WAC06614]RSS51763.1 hypothetical protein EF918_35455 [Streptomyces sp. WAC06614]
MELLPAVAGPGVGEHADAAAETACHLYDSVAVGGWSRDAAEDAVEAIETTAHALASTHPRAALVLAPLHAALADLRRQLCLPPPDTAIATGPPQMPRTVGNPRRTRRTQPFGLPVAGAAAPTPAGPPPGPAPVPAPSAPPGDGPASSTVSPSRTAP